MSDLKFILIGLGRIGQRHITQIQRVGRLVAVCDINPMVKNNLAADVEFYSDVELLLAANVNADVAVVCTPNYLHCDQTVALLQAEYHVLCEKPMALSVQDCQTMNEAAKKYQKKLFVVKQNRFNPPVVKVKEWLDSGVLGKVYSIQVNGFWNRNKTYFKSDWTGSKGKAGGILHTQFSHFIDITQWLFGELDISSSMCENRSGRLDFEFSDTVLSVAKFRNGILGNFHFSINSFDQNMEGSITILAENGTVKIGGQYLNQLEYVKIQGIDAISIPSGMGANNYGTYQGSMSNHHLVYQNLINVFEHNVEISSSGEDGQHTLEMIEQILQG